ncbi:MAG: hydrogenase, partial [Candidatus Omnitrophica bacterium]|nr:hydrogenase [Candidatus Omnitrophota bacterium]
AIDVTASKKKIIQEELDSIKDDVHELKKMLFSSVSFMDRVDGAGTLRKKTAEDLGVVGLAARACGITADTRKDFPGIYQKVALVPAKQTSGDVLARLLVRFEEFETSLHLIAQFLGHMDQGPSKGNPLMKDGCALGVTECWRGPVLYWAAISNHGALERCKIVDPSFHNWQALSYSVLGDIIPDFPLCNKSFDLSYSGNDL